tara:strand:+ start:216 stop:449 length:234 start_codon:yes stop_codon:yes gene_type:complete
MSKIGNYVVGLQEQQHFIECPECKDTYHQGKVTGEEFKWTGDTYEPFETWVDCDNCSGLGEIERDDDDEDEGASCGQ